MERSEEMKTENSARVSSFPDQISTNFPFSGVFDVAGLERSSSIGLMELLGIQDLDPSIFDFSLPPPSHFPATPNSLSISSSSMETTADEQVKAPAPEEEEQENPNKLLKPKQKIRKREREPRFAFMTKSQIDHLEDGYRWRKYGQKAVKNSSFPRSYYRCTSLMCGVKKRVERSYKDPTVVMTTYEGQHMHPSPVTPRRSSVGIRPDFGGFPLPVQMTQSHQPQDPPYFLNLPPTLNFSSSTSLVEDRRFCTSAVSLLRDHGLLQDILPSDVRRDQ
ncbi:putative WRKY transcription factor 48 isoform X2 [Tasmannia lanceolata]|uniref:putative WRKY transcription factor 48 isoform X2 n=1 Tax=Tasmannia lanceolata TaxID=3420 RepID=UPI00406427B0